MKRPFILGITGSIGTGKSTALKMLKARDTACISADQIVHNLIAPEGKAVRPLAHLFPEAVRKKGIDRKKLGAIVFSNPKALKQVEAILHPLVEKEQRRLYAGAVKTVKNIILLEIPLLFETKAEKRCDAVLCLTVSKKIQAERVLQRKNMTPAKLKAILQRQMPEKEKKKRADFVIDTGKGIEDTKMRLHIIRQGIRDLCVK